MEPISSTILGSFTEAVVSQCLEAIGEQSWGRKASNWLSGKPAQVAYQRALAAAITAFARRYPILANSLFDEHFLMSEPMTAELSRTLQRNGAPDPAVIVNKWKQQFAIVPEIELEEPVRYFLSILEAELKAQPVLSPIFDQRALEKLPSIATNTEVINQTLIEITYLLGETNRLLATSAPKYSTQVRDARGVVIGDGNTVYQYFLPDGRFRPFAEKLYSFTTLINEKTRGFVGRQFVFDAINQFTSENDSGYFIIQGEPGIGKTTFAARLVQSQNHIHHFVIASQGISRTEQFLESVAVQLIAKYGLDHPYSSRRTIRDSGYLSQLLESATAQLAHGERIVIVVDALDEAEQTLDPQANVLYLPPYLPRNVFFVVTTRPLKELPLRVETATQTLYLAADSEENALDVLLYLRNLACGQAIKDRLKSDGLTVEQFIETMLAKSEGNFMYLHYVIPEIEKGKYNKLLIHELPQGLSGYYETHWREIRAQDENLWIKYRQPILCFLAAAHEPISAEYLSILSKHSINRVRAVLRDWWQFLDKEIVEGEERYRIYHASFQDFLRDKDEVGEVDLTRTHAEIADVLLEGWRSLSKR